MNSVTAMPTQILMPGDMLQAKVQTSICLLILCGKGCEQHVLQEKCNCSANAASVASSHAAS